MDWCLDRPRDQAEICLSGGIPARRAGTRYATEGYAVVDGGFGRLPQSLSTDTQILAINVGNVEERSSVPEEIERGLSSTGYCGRVIGREPDKEDLIVAEVAVQIYFRHLSIIFDL
jgi:hypothetical protein